MVDLLHGFHQMPLRKDNRPLTCMRIPCGPVHRAVMMVDVLFIAHPELRAFVSVYIDDIIATEKGGLPEEEVVPLHEKLLNHVMDILDANQLICGLKRGKLFLKSVEFLAFSWTMARDDPIERSSSLFESGSTLRPSRN